MDCPGLQPRRDNTLEEQAYFKKIHGQVLKSFSAYVERMDVVSRSIERLIKVFHSCVKTSTPIPMLLYKC